VKQFRENETSIQFVNRIFNFLFIKKWEYFNVFQKDALFSFLIADIGYAGSIQYQFYNYTTN